jgi:hypothetical protein
MMICSYNQLYNIYIYEIEEKIGKNPQVPLMTFFTQSRYSQSIMSNIYNTDRQSTHYLTNLAQY